MNERIQWSDRGGKEETTGNTQWFEHNKGSVSKIDENIENIDSNPNMGLSKHMSLDMAPS